MAYLVELVDRDGDIRAKALCDVASDNDAIEAAERLMLSEWDGFNVWEHGRFVHSSRSYAPNEPQAV